MNKNDIVTRELFRGALDANNLHVMTWHCAPCHTTNALRTVHRTAHYFTGQYDVFNDNNTLIISTLRSPLHPERHAVPTSQSSPAVAA